MIAELRGTRKHYSLDNLCAAFGYTRQAWYNRLKRSELQAFQEHMVLQKIKEIRKDLPKTGCIKLYQGYMNRLVLLNARQPWVSLQKGLVRGWLGHSLTNP